MMGRATLLPARRCFKTRTIDAVERFDVIVVGAGPAGSTAAYRLAEGGAKVLLLDRQRFPRDKPCGGGLTYRAVRQLPVSVDPVVEDVVDRFELGLRYGKRFERGGDGAARPDDAAPQARRAPRRAGGCRGGRLPRRAAGDRARA